MHKDPALLDPELLLASLNDAQCQAVAAPLGRQLVLAGAGSGKTRVLVHRIAFLIQFLNASPYSILSVTFTNKAAAEMRQRIEQMLGQSPAGMWVGTFHGLAHRILRAHWQEAGLSENFQILDSDDQQRLVKRVIRELGLDEQRWPAKQAQWFINGQKDEGLRPKNIQPGGDLFLATMLKIYQAYEDACARTGVIDFAELLLRALDLWRDKPDLLAHYQKRFRHILVDEFQDTNAVQYAWLRFLAKGGESLMVVGDDDQSIYGWRGAKIENIQQFSSDFPDTQLIRLEQNYRSTAGILKAANALIANNNGRLGKELWTDGSDGEPISLYAAFNEHDEARYVVESIEAALRKDGLKRSEIAILYRSNAQSRVLEEALLREKIPYRIYGGQRFFERAEIKGSQGTNDITGDDAAFGEKITGGAKADTITGGAGADDMTGNGGRDAFIQNAGDSGTTAATIDQISDFGKVTVAATAAEVTAMTNQAAFQATATARGGDNADVAGAGLQCGGFDGRLHPDQGQLGPKGTQVANGGSGGGVAGHHQ